MGGAGGISRRPGITLLQCPRQPYFFVLESFYRSNSSHLFRDKKEKENVILTGKKDTPLRPKSVGLPSVQDSVPPIELQEASVLLLPHSTGGQFFTLGSLPAE